MGEASGVLFSRPKTILKRENLGLWLRWPLGGSYGRPWGRPGRRLELLGSSCKPSRVVLEASWGRPGPCLCGCCLSQPLNAMHISAFQGNALLVSLRQNYYFDSEQIGFADHAIAKMLFLPKRGSYRCISKIIARKSPSSFCRKVPLPAVEK